MGDIKPESDLGSDPNGKPSQEGSQTPDDKPISRLSEAARAEVSQIVTDVLENYDNKQRSQKDRGVAAANKTSKEALIAVGQLRDELAAKGLMTDEIGLLLDRTQSASEFKQLQESVATLLQQGVGSPATGAQLDFVDAFTKTGYDVNQLSPEDWLFVSNGKFQDQVALQNALLARRNSQTSPADPSGVVQPSGGESSKKSDLDADMQKEIAESVKGLSAQARIAKINEIESKYNRLKAQRS
jgi:hypothetical protein